MNPTNENFIGIILDDAGRIKGTGFVIHVEERLIATAQHVIKSTPVAKLRFQLFNTSNPIPITSIVASRPENAEDIALLQLMNPLPTDLRVPDLILDVTPTTRVSITGNGGDEDRNREYRSTIAQIAGSLKKWDGISYYHLILDEAPVLRGMSGSPVIVPNRGIVGILIERGRQGTIMERQAVVVPISHFAQLDERIETPRSKYLGRLIKHLAQQQNLLEIEDYVDLPVEFADSPSEESKKDYFSSIFELPEGVNKYILVGSPGSGKTATLRELASRAARKCLVQPDAMIPIYIKLSRLRTHSDSFLDFLENQILKEQRNLFGSLVHGENISDFLDQQKFSYFFDGLEEVEDGEELDKLQQWVKTQSYVILSCRDLNFTPLRQFAGVPVVTIRSLSTSAIYQFAAKYLRDNTKADNFVSRIIPEGYEDDSQKARMSEMARNPFFLMLMLVDYQDDSTTYASTQWKLFENIVKKLWLQKRIQNRLLGTPLERKYSSIKSIIEALSSVAYKYVGQSTISQSEFTTVLEQDVILVLDEAGFLNAAGGDTYRFRHQLFADYFVACEILAHQSGYKVLDDVSSYLSPIWLPALVILSTRGEAERKTIQQAILAQVKTASTSDYLRWALGEIGDETIIDAFELNIKYGNHDVMRMLAKIVNRLPDSSLNKQRVIEYLEEVLRSNTSNYKDDDSDWHEYGGWHIGAGDKYSAADMISYIKGPRIVRVLLDALLDASSKTRGRMMGGQLMRQQWFSAYLARQGEPAVQLLLDALAANNDPELVTTVSEALRRIDRPIKVDAIARILETNPNPMARENAALRLGRDRSLEAVPVLIKSLRDQGVWIRGGIMMPNTYHYVADSVALALAHIGTAECIEALRSHSYQYDEDTEQLSYLQPMLKRLDDTEDVDPYNPEVRTYLARSIANTQSGIQKLIPRMGHFQFLVYEGYRLNDPVAKALVNRYSDSKSDDPLTRRRSVNYYDVTPEMFRYLQTSEDIQSSRWVCVVIGHVADITAFQELVTMLASHPNPELREAAAYAVGHLISRHSDSPIVQELPRIVQYMIEILDVATPKPFGGVGLGLAQIAEILKRDYPQIFSNLLSILLNRLTSNDLSRSKTSLDTLVSLVQSLPDEVRTVATENPISVLREANEQFWDSMFKDRAGYIYEAWQPDWSGCISAFENVLTLKSRSSLGYSEKDWIDLGCSNVLVLHHLGRVYVALENWEQACTAYEQVYQDFLKNQHRLMSEVELLRMVAFVLREAGNILQNILQREDFSRIDDYYSKGIQLCESIDHEDLLFELHDRKIQLFDQIQKPTGVIAHGQIALKLLPKIQEYGYGHFDDERDIRLRLSRAYFLTGDFQSGLDVLSPLEYKARRLKLNKLLASVLISMAGSQTQLGDLDGFEGRLQEAQFLLEEAGEWSSAGYTLQMLASQLDFDTESEKALSLFRQAMSYVEKSQSLYTPDQKAQIYHGMGSVYLAQEKYEDAERHFQEAIDVLQKLNMPENLTAVMSQYAVCLHQAGKVSQAQQIMNEAVEIRRTANIELTQDIQIAMAEIFTRPGTYLPSFWLSDVTRNVLEIINGYKPGTEISQYLTTILMECKRQNWIYETEFVQALLLATKQEPATLSAISPYIQDYEPIRAALEAALLIFKQAFNATIEIITKYPERKDEWREQVFLLSYRAFLLSNDYLENSLRGIYEYLIGTDPDTDQLNPTTIQVMRALSSAVKGD